MGVAKPGTCVQCTPETLCSGAEGAVAIHFSQHPSAGSKEALGLVVDRNGNGEGSWVNINGASFNLHLGFLCEASMTLLMKSGMDTDAKKPKERRANPIQQYLKYV